MLKWNGISDKTDSYIHIETEQGDTVSRECLESVRFQQRVSEFNIFETVCPLLPCKRKKRISGFPTDMADNRIIKPVPTSTTSKFCMFVSVPRTAVRSNPCNNEKEEGEHIGMHSLD